MNAVDVVDGAIAETLEMVQMVKDKQLTRTRNLLQKHRTRQRARTGLLRRLTLRVSLHDRSLIDATKGGDPKSVLNYLKLELKKPLGAQFAVRMSLPRTSCPPDHMTLFC